MSFLILFNNNNEINEFKKSLNNNKNNNNNNILPAEDNNNDKNIFNKITNYIKSKFNSPSFHRMVILYGTYVLIEYYFPGLGLKSGLVWILAHITLKMILWGIILNTIWVTLSLYLELILILLFTLNYISIPEKYPKFIKKRLSEFKEIGDLEEKGWNKVIVLNRLRFTIRMSILSIVLLFIFAILFNI